MLIDHYSHVLDPSAGEVKGLQADATMDGPKRGKWNRI